MIISIFELIFCIIIEHHIGKRNVINHFKNHIFKTNTQACLYKVGGNQFNAAHEHIFLILYILTKHLIGF